MKRIFAHAMLQEIYDQPEALRATLAAYTLGHGLREELFAPAASALSGAGLLIAASGSSRHAALIGKALFEDLAQLPTGVEYASEYITRDAMQRNAPAMLVLSQSGETADTLDALRDAHARGLPTLAITNHEHSAMARLAGYAFTTHAGAEHAIPATKSFTTQLLLLHLLALYSARLRGRLTADALAEQLAQLRALPEQIASALPAWEQSLLAVAAQLQHAQAYLFLGRALHFPIASEGALKLKESACVPAEGYPAGELKHGPAALLGNSSSPVPLVVLATVDRGDPGSTLRYRKTCALLAGMREHGAHILALVTAGDTTLPPIANAVIEIPQASEHMLPLLEIVPLQLLAYTTAIRRGINVDQPRNLSKAVLIE